MVLAAMCVAPTMAAPHICGVHSQFPARPPFGGRAGRSEREVGAAVDLDACRGGAGRRRDVDRG